MTDRVYPSSSKPNGTTKTTTTATRLPPPPSKAQFQTTNRHPHRPNPTTNHRQSRRRSCFCLCFFWSTLILVLLLLIATIAGCILYLLYHPLRPTFSITSLKISEFNLVPNNSDDTTTKLTSKLNLTISTKNPNKKITFYYNPFTITCFSSDNTVLFANGSFKSPFVSKPDNITIIHSSLYGNSVLMDTEAVNKIRSDLRKKSGVPFKIVLDSEARVKIENIIRSKKIGIQIKCEGIHSLVPKERNMTSKSVAANVSAAKCKLDLRIKIWKWTF